MDTIKHQHLRTLLYTARGVAWVAGTFSIMVLLLIGLNYLQRETADPLHAEAYEKLIELSRTQKDNPVLREQIRSFDLLARKAFFSSRSFAHTGAYLLLGGVMVCLGALKTITTLKAKLPLPSRAPETESAARMAYLARRWVTVMGCLMALGAVSLVYLTREHPGETAVPEPTPDYAAWESHRKNWPSFRGPGGLSTASGSGFPTAWDAARGKNIRWKSEIPLAGFNSPVVWGNRVFLSGNGEQELAVFCYDADTGKLLWNKPVRRGPNAPAAWPEVTEDTGYAAPTMATDGRRVFAIFATGDLAAFDFDGNAVWQRSLGVPKNHYGHASSLIVYQDLLLVLYDHDNEARLIGIEVQTGNTRWETPRPKKMTWTSPTLADTGERMELFVLSDPNLTSYNPVTGAQLWQLEVLSGEIAPSPAYAGGLVFVGHEYPHTAAVNAKTGQIVWTNEDDTPDIPSPLAVGDLLFTAMSYNPLTCLDARTGERLWQHKFEEDFYASPVAAEGRVYFQGKDGTMEIFKAARTYEPVGQGHLGEQSTCTPAFVNGRIYIRGFKHLFCVEQGEE